ncbi:MAG: Multi-sensor hybrid histidine kinase, partial [Candidatus Collierbacteria bacterium GW2011_GWB1_44_6]
MDFARKWITTKNVFLLIIAVVLLTFGYLGTREYEKWLLNDNREKVSETLQIYQRSIESILIRRLGLVNGLDRFVVSRGDKEIEKDFLVFAPGLHNDFEGVRNVGIAPQGVLTLIYPLRGNEQAMGYNLLTDETPSVKSDVSRAIETGDVVVSDPFQLRQGGLGIAARKTIYKNGKLWGLVSVVVDVPTVIDYSGLVKGSENLDLSLRDKTGKVFWGNEKIFENNPVIQKIVTVDGYWELGGIGLGGWSSSIRSTLNIFVLFVWTLGVLIWLLISLLLKKEISLIISEEKISERTKSLRIVAVYLVVGVAWIFFSDRALLYVFTSPELINQLQTIKGWLFVLISSLIIYWLIEINYGRYLVTSRALRSVLASSRLLALAETEKYLYQGICDALVKEGGYVMAWVGLVEKNKNGLIKQIAVAGKSEGFLDELKITMTRAIGERTPCSMAITSGKPVIINDIDEVKDYPEWRLAAEKRGYRALIAIPLKENGKPFGLIGIYSNKTNVFSYGDLEVLSSYASDLVFGLRTLQLRTSRTEAEVKLEKLYTSMAEGVAFYEYVRDKKNRIVNYTILDANPAYKHHSGIDPDFVKGKLVTEVFGVKKPPYLKEYTDIIKTKKPVVFETYFSPLDRYFYVSAVYLGQDRFSTIFQDITERKNIENSLAKTNKEIHSQKQKLEVILRDMGDAVFVTDTEKKVVLVNRAMENLFGLAEKEMMGKSIEEVMMLSYESSGKKPDDLIKTVFDKKKPARPVE